MQSRLKVIGRCSSVFIGVYLWLKLLSRLSRFQVFMPRIVQGAGGACFAVPTLFFAFSRSASLGVPQTTRLGFCLRISSSSSTEARERRRLLRLCASSG